MGGTCAVREEPGKQNREVRCVHPVCGTAGAGIGPKQCLGMRGRKRASAEINESQDEERNRAGISADYS